MADDVKAPAFQFYTGDFVGSGAVGMASTEEVGVYTLLLCLDWEECGFELDVVRLARWCKTSKKKFLTAWQYLAKNFEEREGRWYNHRLDKEREKQKLRRERLRENGKLGGRPKKPKGFEDENQNETKRLSESEPNENLNERLSSSSSSSSSELKEKESEGADTSADADGIPVETYLRLATEQFGDHWPGVLEFLRSRRQRTWRAWLKELLVLIGGGSPCLPLDVEGACRDALALDTPIDGPVALRAFAMKRMRERRESDRGDAVPAATTQRRSGPVLRFTRDFEAEGAAIWADIVNGIYEEIMPYADGSEGNYRAKKIRAEVLDGLTELAREALQAVGGVQAVATASEDRLSKKATDFAKAYAGKRMREQVA